MSTENAPVHGRTLIICCDGTWMDSDDGYVKDSFFGNPRLQIPSNVTRIGRAIKPTTTERTNKKGEHIDQIVYYQAGVGTGTSYWDKYVGGAAGLGLSENCREAYAFLANNYGPGDEIVLIGFSRGAFTARSIAGLIGHVGLLTKKGLGKFYGVFKDYEQSADGKDSTVVKGVPFLDPRYAAKLAEDGTTRTGVKIKAVAVWDTVGSLGLPKTTWIPSFLYTPANKEYAFHDTRLHSAIENAFQALALDERRPSFAPAVWELCEKKSDSTSTPNQPKQPNLKQVWFPGVHSNSGGGFEDAELSNITMAWMMDQLSPFIEFDSSYLEDEYKAYTESRIQHRAWGCGMIPNSVKHIYVLAGGAKRTPGHYFATDPKTDRPTSTLLQNTEEFVHASVRTRWRLPGHGINNKGLYEPESLKGWTLMGLEPGDDSADPDLGDRKIWWQYDGHDAKFKSAKNELPEDKLGPYEKLLLKHHCDTYDQRPDESCRDHPRRSLGR